MDSENGGLSSDARQRATAAEIARKKVLSAYSSSPTFSYQAKQMADSTASPIYSQPQAIYSSASDTKKEQDAGVYQTTQLSQTFREQQINQVSEQPVQQAQPNAYPAGQQAQYKSASINMAMSKQDLQQYHTAWQSYYQKYYNDYYTKAAKQYIETTKLKYERQKNDDERLGADNLNAGTTNTEAVEKTLRQTIQEKANSRFKIKKRHRKFIPIFIGVFVTLFVLFLQYNRMIFAPIMAYIAPGNSTDSGEISAIDPTVTTPVSETNKLIIPKLNIDVPVHFGISNDTKTVNEAMKNGVAHFMIPGADAFPGQVGNTVITGHSAGDIYSSNQYKFIFSGLERLVEGDLIYVDYNKVRYTYRMVGRDTVNPEDTESLVYTGDKPVLTLVTCWPLGTSRYRLLIHADQINPAVANSEPAESTTTNSVDTMPQNEKTFFENVWDFLTGQ